MKPYSFSWRFGNESNVETGEKALHTFDKPGDYAVTLEVNDSALPSQNATAKMMVSIDPPTNQTVTRQLVTETIQLVTKIEANTTNATAPSTIEFRANSTGGVKPYSFSWRFGNESNVETGEKALHTFDKPGDYAVTLEVNDSALPSQNATAKMMISIASPLDRIDDILANSSTLNQNETAAVAAASVNQSTDVWNGTNITEGTTEIAEMFNDNNTSSSILMPHSNSSQSNSSETLSLTAPESNTLNYSIINHDSRSDTITKTVPSEKMIKTIPNNNTTKDAKEPSAIQLVNHAPISVDVVQPLNGNGEAKIVLKATDQDNDKITFEIDSSPMHGTITGFNKDHNTLTYVQNSTFHGTDSFTFKSIDIHGVESNIGRVTVHSSRPNPLLQYSSNLNVATFSNAPLTITLRTALTMPDDKNELRFSITVPPSHGKLSDFFDLKGASAKVIYTPKVDYVGEDLIRYRVDYPATDTSSTGQVSIKVIATPHISNPISSPVAKDQKVLLDENKELDIILGGTLRDGDSYSYSIVTKPIHGKISAFDPLKGNLIYKPDSKFSGLDSFAFMVSNQNGMHSKTAQVILQVGSISSAGKERESNILESNSAQSDGSPSEKAVLDKRSEGDSSVLTNHNPSANAGPDRVVGDDLDVVPLKGTGSDPDGDRVIFLWTQTSGPRVQLNQRNSEQAIFNASGLESKKELKFTLHVSDGKGGHDADSVKILIMPKTLVHVQPGQDYVQGRILMPVIREPHEFPRAIKWF